MGNLCSGFPAVSVVFPCLNEEEAVGQSVSKVLDICKKANIDVEVIVVDNGSIDNSVRVAMDAGARVVIEPRRGYGNALITGFQHARGKYLIMCDADLTYELEVIPLCVDLLHNRGFDLVIGNRFSGKMTVGSMPWLHRYIGNPFLSWLTRKLYGVDVTDVHCGLRALTRSSFHRMHLSSPGMEFATEMVIAAGILGLKVAQIPVGYYRRIGRSKLRTFRDGMRHLFFLLRYRHNRSWFLQKRKEVIDLSVGDLL